MPTITTRSVAGARGPRHRTRASTVMPSSLASHGIGPAATWITTAIIATTAAAPATTIGALMRRRTARAGTPVTPRAYTGRDTLTGHARMARGSGADSGRGRPGRRPARARGP